MAKFKYTLPSGDVFTLNAPAGTTKITADKVFYEQVAAGTFAGYKIGDTLTHPIEKFQQFGITRLQRGTAGVDDKTLLAVIANLPIVAPIPTTLSTTPVTNPINQANFIQVNSNSTQGVFVPPPPPIGPLTSAQVQGIMAQISTDVNQNANVITQEKGVGKYGFNAIQLERAGYIKPGYSARYCPVNKNNNQNPSNFVSFMNSPAPWTGLGGVTNVNDILTNEALQNQIQQLLMTQSYNGLVSTGTIIPPVSSVTTPSVATGQVYTNDGILTSISPLGLFTANPSTLNSSNMLLNTTTKSLGDPVYFSGINSVLASSPLGSIPESISNLGANAVANYTQSLNTLASGAVNFASSPVSAITNSVGSASQLLNGATSLSGLSINSLGNLTNISNVGIDQLSGLASGATDALSAISTTVTSDVGSLMGVASKFGVDTTNLWASTTGDLANLGGELSSTVSDITGSLGSTVSDITGSLSGTASDITSSLSGNLTDLTSGLDLGPISGGITDAMDSLGLSSSFGSAFGDLGGFGGAAGLIGGGLDGGTQVAGAFSNTVNRLTLDSAATRVIGSPLIPPPNYDLPGAASLGSALNISTAQNLLSSAFNTINGFGNLGNQAVNIASGGINTLTGGLTNQATGVINNFATGIGGLF